MRIKRSTLGTVPGKNSKNFFLGVASADSAMMTGSTLEARKTTKERENLKYGEDPPEGKVELDHVIGFSGRCIAMQGSSKNGIVYSAGCLILTSDLAQLHNQHVLQGHSAFVSAMAVDHGGNRIISGQYPPPMPKQRPAPLLVWDLPSEKNTNALLGLTATPLCIAFSCDDRFVAAGDEEGRVYVWDMHSDRSDPCGGYKGPSAMTALTWGRTRIDEGGIAGDSNRETTLGANSLFPPPQKRYAIITAHRNLVRKVDLSYDASYALLGTATGEVCVFSISSDVYRTIVPISANGVHSLCAVGDYVYAGAGDGKVTKLKGKDKDWEKVLETYLEGKVTSLSPLQDGSSILAGTDSGIMYRLDCATLEGELLSEHTVKDITALATSPGIGHAIVGCTSDAQIRIWDLQDYKVTSSFIQSRKPPVTCSTLSEDGKILAVGQQDGSLTCFNRASGQVLWHNACAHRGAVTSVILTEKSVMSSGQDKAVRLWPLRAPELLYQFTDSQAPAVNILLDARDSSILHACYEDRLIVHYDLNIKRRAKYHTVPDGGRFVNMGQMKTGDCELVTASTEGRIVTWDYRDPKPTRIWIDDQEVRVRTMALSPSGKFAAYGTDDGVLKVIKLSRCQLFAYAKGAVGRIQCLVWTPDGKHIICSDAKGGQVKPDSMLVYKPRVRPGVTTREIAPRSRGQVMPRESR
ncbi:hypothetical protein CBR_g19335 [Chara braunii]|uniref:Anaphase-promoting complex subunit 4 WD40 domain-containing protein n=1 Tax=Chara braunii TaxID=69332 RepID=A0A388KXZ7_CHABU|nr:hypothetical protein CBR_g19335 [Chara braunii]|eukprot:GBG74823.1 hypothetical protein CBR_g19335 [Chara braunii]